MFNEQCILAEMLLPSKVACTCEYFGVQPIRSSSWLHSNYFFHLWKCRHHGHIFYSVWIGPAGIILRFNIWKPNSDQIWKWQRQTADLRKIEKRSKLVRNCLLTKVINVWSGLLVWRKLGRFDKIEKRSKLSPHKKGGKRDQCLEGSGVTKVRWWLSLSHFHTGQQLSPHKKWGKVINVWCDES